MISQNSFYPILKVNIQQLIKSIQKVHENHSKKFTYLNVFYKKKLTCLSRNMQPY